MAEFKKTSYAYQKDSEYLKKIKDFLTLLPPYVSRYVTGISSNVLPSTRFAYLTDLHTFFVWLLDKNPSLSGLSVYEISLEHLSVLTKMDFEEFFVDIRQKSDSHGNISEGSIKGLQRKYASLNSFFKYLYDSELLEQNPFSKVQRPSKREDHSIISMTRPEAEQFQNNVQYGEMLSDRAKKHHDHYVIRDVALTSLMLGTGIRVSECVGLDMEHVNLEEQSITVYGKGGKSRKLYFSDEVATYLSEYLLFDRKKQTPKAGSEHALFLSNRLSRITTRSVENLIVKYAKSAIPGKHITAHKLRSTMATEFYAQTNDIYLTSTALGHTSPTVTAQAYANQNAERLKVMKQGIFET